MSKVRNILKPDKVEEAIKSGDRAKLPDGGSLYLMVRRKGRAYWVVRYRDGARIRSKGLGAVAKVTLREARRARDAFMGIEPSKRSDKHPRRHAPKTPTGATFGEAHAIYQANHAGVWKPGQRKLVARLFANHTGPLDALPIAAITAEHIADLLRKPLYDKKGKPLCDKEGKPLTFWRGPATGQASRLRGLMAKVFEVAGIEPNPAKRALLLLPSKTKTVRHHPAMAWDNDDVPALLRELAADTGAVSRCLRFVILTGVRTSEATGATWGEINLGDMLWKIPASRMKAGEDHAVPLSDAGAACLGPPADGLVFSVGRLSLNVYLKKRRPGITVHGFRATLSSWAQEQDFTIETIDGILAHKETNRTRRAYNRSKVLAKRRKLLEQWASFCKVLI